MNLTNVTPLETAQPKKNEAMVIMNLGHWAVTYTKRAFIELYFIYAAGALST